MSRIAVAGFMHETNCFVPTPTDLEDFGSAPGRPPVLRGDEITSQMAESGSGMGGFLSAHAGNHEIAPLLWTSALPGGVVTARAFETLASEIVARLSDALPVDGVYLDLHGAMVAADFEDGEGELLRRVRAVVGETVPIVISLDYHANVTTDMLASADAVLPYRTYPHVDQRDAGARAAAAMTRLLVEGRPAGRAQRHLPFLLPLNFQCTFVEPSKGIVDAAAARETEEIVSLAYLAGFPAADLRQCGPSVSVHAVTQAAADAAADEIAALILSKEAEFAEPLLSPVEAVGQARELIAAGTRPVVIADTQDNPGCGGSGDTVGLLQAMVEGGAKNALFGMLADAEAAKAAHDAGIGAMLDLSLGGRSDLPGVHPFPGRFEVIALSDGCFRADGAVSQGRDVDVGPAALLRIGGVDIAVGSRRIQTLDRAVFEHFGLSLPDRDIIALKSTCHFRADFDPIAARTLIAIAPGGYIADPANQAYRRLRAGVRLSPLGPEHSP